ncbi:zinc ABC transporter substrate-binding protein [Arthrobacter sp. PAMC25284]|nr:MULTISPECIES: zinc ABC transporter substrate-binding protein [Arthrobacter]QYF91567.1 zinc ABC transporter substrate-binding protein [Arthrobacter sp. PAMC25284]
MRRPAPRALMTAVAGITLVLTACGTPAGSGGGETGDGTVDVVASTSVYGDIVSIIGGDKVRVTALISRVSQDPHSYEATTQDKLAVSKAELIVENGGGYDDFIHKLADDTGLDHGSLISAVDVSGLAPAAADAGSSAAPDGAGHSHGYGSFNEHVWYSLPAMGRLADAVAARLADLEPANAETFRINAVSFKESLGQLEARLAALKSTSDQVPMAVTEPVPLYLLEDAGLENKMPMAYLAAIEDDADVPPVVLKDAVDLMGSGAVRLLAYNTQTEGPQTQAVKKAAEDAGVTVLDFRETLPEGQSYVQWMTANVDSISAALG